MVVMVRAVHGSTVEQLCSIVHRRQCRTVHQTLVYPASSITGAKQNELLTDTFGAECFEPRVTDAVVTARCVLTRRVFRTPAIMFSTLVFVCIKLNININYHYYYTRSAASFPGQLG